MNTDCTKCSAPMPPAPHKTGAVNFRTTGYRCEQCGHWNDLKRRKGYAEWDAQRREARHGKA